MQSLSDYFLHFLQPVYLWLETTFGTVQKWSLRPLLDSSKGGRNIGILLYFMCVRLDTPNAYLYFRNLKTRTSKSRKTKSLALILIQFWWSYTTYYKYTLFFLFFFFALFQNCSWIYASFALRLRCTYFFFFFFCFIYSEIPLLRPPKMKRSYLFKTLFAKFKWFFSSFSTPSVPLIRDHLWDCPKVVFKTTFGQFQRWSLYRNFTVYRKKYCSYSFIAS